METFKSWVPYIVALILASAVPIERLILKRKRPSVRWTPEFTDATLPALETAWLALAGLVVALPAIPEKNRLLCGVIAFVLVLLAVATRVHASKRKSSTRPLHTQLGHEAIEFAYHRKLQQASPLKDFLCGANSVEAALQTGRTSSLSGAWTANKPSPLILLDPRGTHAENHAITFGVDIASLKSDIEATTRKAQEAGIKVKWLDRPMPFTLMIIDRNSPGACVQMGIPLPLVNAVLADRPHVIVRLSNHPEFYAQLVPSQLN